MSFKIDAIHPAAGAVIYLLFSQRKCVMLLVDTKMTVL